MSESSNPKDRIGRSKLPFDLLPVVPQGHTALAMLDGDCKYGTTNWRHETVAARVYIAAAFRHLLRYASGLEKDKTSHVHHLGHMCACAYILMDAEAAGNLIDDRSTNDYEADFIDEMSATVDHLLELHKDKIEARRVAEAKEVLEEAPLQGSFFQVTRASTPDDIEAVGAPQPGDVPTYGDPPLTGSQLNDIHCP